MMLLEVDDVMVFLFDEHAHNKSVSTRVTLFLFIFIMN